MDPLSDVLSLLKPRNYLSAGLEAGGNWSIQFPDQQAAIKCGAVVSGRCWLSVDGAGEAVRLEAGDCFLLPRGRPFRLASDMSLPAVDARTIFSPARTGGVTCHNGGGDFLLVSSRFALAGDQAGMLLRMLPPIVHIRGDAGHSALRWPVERMMQELREQRPGGFLVVEHLAHMILIEALRLHMADGLRGGVGWLFALADRQIGAAIGAMHEEPAHGWTLQALAGRARMSRSTFALKFKEMVGASPMDYLTRWRMLRAGDRLANSSDSISAIALSLGYESESAFSTAFKRVMGRSPRQYGRDHASPGLANDETARMLESAGA
ncbi:MAG: AraC family transcriptional regulator [Mesorhizobium sp.]|nr:AraC family transcriptional regulator [bacterium M00.F.Ca.ET.205.01.1.1]TGU55375.1 AraC family transcriptional regulator [bacterium M00.F.Ca.ET.152.01.1.1]TGV40335.1 AraC family transcriptional regulator [Mesorhizobium sp. M00.F.Ca.ET.186.01.1.1]TGZ45331.1 AraC family transcriptional regulator [bacterium M00.F.Ca.ET.162.01.1.1]TIW61512.1 MAG: AraC family transcriptional regulator [Mesorhizobium sp.]